MTTQEKTIALVTGAGRREGIGYEVCRQLAQRGMTVLLTARDGEAAAMRARDLRAEGLDVSAERLDVTEEATLRELAATIESTHGRLDVLINNAAATAAFGEKPSATDLRTARDAMEATLFGAWRTTQAFLPLLRKSRGARIVNVSSGAGSHGDPAFGLSTKNSMGPAYGIAKAALNALTSTFANELAGTGILVNAVCPGFTATFAGGESMGARPVADGAASVLWAALLEHDGPSGGFFRDGKPLPW